MVPTPNELPSYDESSPVPDTAGERVVISGMSGLYPESHNVKELSDILYNKINPIANDNSRWTFDHPEVSQYTGKVPGLELFDAQFFRIYHLLCNNMDPMNRKLLEHVYQALYDAGVCLEEVSGKKVGVFIGNSLTESEKVNIFRYGGRHGTGILGASRAMFANRISYWLNVKGPSMTIDTGSCSSTQALEQAYLAIKSGQCDAAIVGGAHICLHPQSFVHFGRIIKLNTDGKTKSFDTEAAGCAMSEAINVLFLQKAKDAFRIHAEVVHVKCRYISSELDETKNQKYSFHRDPQKMVDFINTFYEEIQILPQAVEYVEAFGSADPDLDKAELVAIEKAFCNNRRNSLLVGSVMSNIGYTDCASGLSSITKVLLGYHNGLLAGNLNCDSPRTDIAALRDGRMRILTDHHSFARTYIAVNGFSLSGVDSHVLLYGHYKAKDPMRYKISIPHLVVVSGRQDSSVENLFKNLKSRSIDPEEIALLHNIHKTRISGHLGRGYTLLDTNKKGETICLSEQVNYYDDVKRPLWFVYSGMGSQWAGMGAQLMRIPIFAAAIEKCHQVLQPKGVDIVHIITSQDKTIFDNILHSFVGIAAIQIGLTDVLRAVEIIPDKIIGHSVGELGCAYADGCFTAEEMILSAYSRGLVSVQTSFIRGSMAAVGVGYEQISNICPPEIDIACHNGPNSSTISGPADIMKEFVARLTAKEIFAKEVPCSNIAFHSRYIADAGPALLKYLSNVITSPKERSERWVSTSVPKEKWNDPIAKYSSAEYHTNNLLNSVLFEETSRLIPANAVVVEIAPHGLLQAILKRSLPESCKHVPLTRRGHPDNAQFLLEAIGNLYMEGYNPQVHALYPKVEFPVSTETPMLSHLVEWAHNEEWSIPLDKIPQRKFASSCNYVISIHDDAHRYLKGNVIRDKNLYPFAATLVAVWDTLAMFLGVPKKQLSVQFRDVHLHLQPVLHDQKLLRLYVSVHKGGRFEVLNEDVKVATGYIIVTEIDKNISSKEESQSEEDFALKSENIYELLRARDYNFSDEFRSIYDVNLSLTEAHLLWNNNWVTLIDGMIQLNALRRRHESVSQLHFIKNIVIDVENHLRNPLIPVDDANVMLAKVLDDINSTRCGGVLIENIKFHDLPSINKEHITLKFVPHVPSDKLGNSDEDLPIQGNIVNGMEFALETPTLGDINSIHWRLVSQVGQLSQHGNPVKVHYVGLNDAYVKKTLGVAARENIFDKQLVEYDFSGLTNRGERVMGIVQEELINSLVLAKPELLWPVPEYWTLEEAATVPLAYCLAFYCLYYKSRLFHGCSILVHSGAGALGQAIISIAFAHDCDVYTTVSSSKKKSFLLKLFPQLKEDKIGYSRDTSFQELILNETNRKGCNIVITSVKGELRDASIDCSNLSACVVDTSLVLEDEEYIFGMFHLDNANSYSTLQFSSLFDPTNVEDLKKLRVLVSEGIAAGYVRPLSRVVYAAEDAARALRLQAGSRHVGRVLLNLTDDITCVLDRINCSPNLLQLLISEKAILGIQLAERLINRGARNLHLHCAKESNLILFKVRCWEELGVQCTTSYGNTWNNSICDLLNNNTLENVEGIFCFLNSNTKSEDNNTYLNYLNLVAQKSNWPLKYFAVIDTGKELNDTSRLDVPSNQIKYIKLSSSKMTKNEEDFSISCAIDAIEQALCYNERTITAHHVIKPKGNLLQELARLADFSVPRNMCPEVTLKDMGMNLSKSQIVRAYLSNIYYISLKEIDIPTLTAKELWKIEDNNSQNEFPETDDLKTFISHIQCDELLANKDVIFLPTLTSNETLNLDQFAQNAAYLCIIPGIEGLHMRFRELCERLKLSAIVLQPTVERPHQTIKEMAQTYVQALQSMIQLKKRFYLLGYESGVLVALEMATILEDQGLTGTIFCIGGSPDEVLEKFEEKLAKIETEELLQVAVAHRIFKLMVNDDNPGDSNLENDLKNIPTWKEKVSFCVQKLLGRIDHSIQYAKEYIEAVYARLVQVRRYHSEPRPLRSRLIYIRPQSLTSGSNSNSPQSYSQQNIVEYELNVPLAYAAHDMRCAAIVNRHLDKDIVEEFDTNNLCESYVVRKSTRLL